MDYCACYTPAGAREGSVVHAAEAITGSYAAGNPLTGVRPVGKDWDAEQARFAERVEAIRAEPDAA
jgi:hypothetical protein